MTMGITSPTSTTGQILKDGTPVISFDANNNATFAGTVVSNTPLGMRNRIINGDMRIDQRNAGASVTPTNGQYIVDRWRCSVSQASKMTAQQSTTAPTGYINSFLITSSSAYTVGASDFFDIRQLIEGLNLTDLAWGTANAVTVTLSFWVRSSLTGTFGGALKNGNSTRSYPFTYSISAVNTWEQKSITIAGDTTGTWLTNNDIGLQVQFGLGVGSTYSGTAGSWSNNNYVSATGATSVVGTNGATFYITGVQLEVGSTATPFERRLYNQELAACQRYFVGIKNDGVNNLLVATSGMGTTTTTAGCMIVLPVEMRTQPSISATSLALADAVNPVANVSSVTLRTDISTTKAIYFGADVASGLTAYRPYYVRFQAGSSGYFNISAEL